MSMHNGFVCYCTLETKNGYEETERKLLQTMGRKCGSWKLAAGLLRLWWYVDSISTAALMAEAARSIPGVSAEAREPLEGE